MKVLLVSHAHPAFSIGGVEVASYTLFEALRQTPGVESHYLAGASPPLARHSDSPLMKLGRGPDETLYWQDDFDLFYLSKNNKTEHIDYLEPFLIDLAPDVVHVHHVLSFGIELIWSIRRALPKARIVMTLHEYLAICANNGQMVKTRDQKLCHRSSPWDCGACFPKAGPGNMMRRKLLITRAFEMVDRFICPSRFLLERYVEWGLPRSKMTVIENGLAQGPTAPPRRLPEPNAPRDRFGFFGQLNPYKGIKVLLDAVKLIPQTAWSAQGGVTIHGGGLERQPESFQREVHELLSKAGSRVRYAGPYVNSDLPKLFRDIDWTIVPSTWWENSPVIIQESFYHRRPVICSNIGGMTEKVHNTVDGIYFIVGQPHDLARCMLRAMNELHSWKSLQENIAPPRPIEFLCTRHIECYSLHNN